jgi:hypothetical protein
LVFTPRSSKIILKGLMAFANPVAKKPKGGLKKASDFLSIATRPLP